MTHDWAAAARQVFHPEAPADVFTLMDRAFKDRENAICLTDASHVATVEHHSWQNLRNRASHLANAFNALGIQKSDGVFFLTRKNVPTIAAQVASLMAGTVCVPGKEISRVTAPEQKIPIIKDIAHKRNTLVQGGALKNNNLLIIDPDLETYLDAETRALFKNVMTLGADGEGTLAELAAKQSTQFDRPALGPEDPTFSLFTSGSSKDVQKCVLYTQQMTATNLRILRNWLEIKPGTTALNALPINHLHGLMQQQFAVLMAGGRCMFMETFEADRFVSLMMAADIVSGVPATWHQVLDRLAAMRPEDVREFCDRPNVFTAGSDKIGADLRKRFHEITGRKLVVRGGSTEMQHAYGNNIHDPDMEEGVGTPFQSYDISVRDPENPLQEVQWGQAGELCMRGPCVVRGYVNNPEATAEAFMPDGFYRSGDSVKWVDGQMVFVGRYSNFIKSGAERFSGSEVEAFYSGLYGFAQIQAVGLFDAAMIENEIMDRVHDKGFGQKVTVVVVPKPGADIETLKADFLKLSEAIPESHLRPRVFVLAKQLPITGVGKINPRKTREALEQGILPGIIEMHSVVHHSDGPYSFVPSIVRSRPQATVRPEVPQPQPQPQQ